MPAKKMDVVYEAYQPALRRSGHGRICLILALAIMSSVLAKGQTFQTMLAKANSGDMPSQLAVAKMYYNGTTGTSGKRDYPTAFTYFQMAANQSSAEANAWLGMCYLYGRGVTRNQSQGLTLIQSSANSNNPVGLRFLGLMYQHGQGVARNYATAASYFSKATALNDPNSYDRLGSMYLRGSGVSQSVNQAVSLYAQGASLGDPWSQVHLGELYDRGASGLTQNSATALQYFSQAAAKGNYVGAFKAAQRYAQGIGAAKNFNTAYGYYKIAALKGYPPAQRALGQAFQYGIGGNAIDLVHAYIWYSLAREQGDKISVKRLAALTPKMTSAQISQAKTLFLQWHSNFAISSSPGSNVIDTNNSVTTAKYTVTITGNNRFNGTAALSVTGLPSGITYSFSPAVIKSSGSSTLTLSRSGSPATGSYALTVRGGNRKIVHTNGLTLNVVTAGTGSVTISGGEQSIAAKSGTGTISFTTNQVGAQTQCLPDGSVCDSGTIYTTANGFNDTTIWPNGQLMGFPVQYLVNTINQDNPYVTASWNQDYYSPVMTLTAKTAGASTNYSLSAGSSSSYDGQSCTDSSGNVYSPCFPQPFVAVTTSGVTLTGGADPISDSGTCTVNVNGTPYSTTFGAGDSAGSIASRLASGMNSGSLVSTSLSGGTISLTADVGGSGSDYSLSASCSYNSSRFSSPSFTVSTSGSSLTGGH